ncbi:hypothetical protein ACFOYW_14185 [Gryllotalpicola reticulitermitis]|uniref:Uncharacterized protein n=1 Tax=Gryllotalpicola reticulitermitis TaxID=1184153 RepID=A0ABV8Q831_9MICO
MVANMRCGTQATYGLRHINNQHGQAWQNIVTKYQLGGTWADLAIWAAEESTTAPSGTAPIASNNTYQYQAPVQIKNSDGKVVRTYTVWTPVSADNDNVITCYPTDGR